MMQMYKISKLCIILMLTCLLPVVQATAKDGKDSNDGNNKFANQELLNSLFNKLYNLEKSKKGKINIVHIGDSHIQADIFTNTIRQALQDQFGNGGWGFTFPYRLIGTNGPSAVSYVSSAVWQSQRNIYPVADVGVGLSGIALFTGTEDFVIQLSSDDKYKFNTLKVVYPTEVPQYKVCISSSPAIVMPSSTIVIGASGASNPSTYMYHKVKSGESLSTIARKYRVTVAQIKNANGLKTNMIHAGKSLKIPNKSGKIASSKSQSTTTASKSKVSSIKLSDDMDSVTLEEKPYYSVFRSDSLFDRIAILPNGKNPTYNLNGFVIENNKPGIIYHTIGVNGAKLSDYIKYPLFFKQLPILQPDMVILSFGTNESFGKLSTTEYLFQLKEFIDNVRKMCGQDITILVMTPPPSLFRRSRNNTYVEDYSSALVNLTNYPVWDLYTRMGGLSAIRAKGENSSLIGRDNVHYTVKGYQIQGEMFANDFINAYSNFKKKRTIGDTFKSTK